MLYLGMTTLLVILQVSSFTAGRCDQWCQDMEGLYFDGGIWNEKEEVCRCYTDFEKHYMRAMKLPFRIRKTPPPEELGI